MNIEEILLEAKSRLEFAQNFVENEVADPYSCHFANEETWNYVTKTKTFLREIDKYLLQSGQEAL